MAFLHNTPKGVLITENMPYRAKSVHLPENISCTACVYDDSDPYLIYRSVANSIILGISKIENKRQSYMEDKFSGYANSVASKPPLMGLIELFLNKSSMYERDAEELKMDIELDYKMGEAFFEAVKRNEQTDNLKNPEFYLIVGKYLKEKGCYYDLITENLILSIRQETLSLFSEETVKEALDYIKKSYIKENFPGFEILKITSGIKELLGFPVIDFIGTDSDNTVKIISFRVHNEKQFRVGVQSVIELKKKNVITLYSDKGKKKKYNMKIV